MELKRLLSSFRPRHGTQEEAAEAYNIAAIKFRDLNAVTNFDMSRYDVKRIAHSNLPVGGVAGKTPASESPSPLSSSVNNAKEPNHMEGSIKQDDKNYWSLLELQNSSQNEKSSANPSASAFHSSALPKYTSGVSTASSQGNDSFFDDNGIIRRRSKSVIPFGTPIAIPGKFGILVLASGSHHLFTEEGGAPMAHFRKGRRCRAGRGCYGGEEKLQRRKKGCFEFP